jgi:hypothetical protein
MTVAHEILHAYPCCLYHDDLWSYLYSLNYQDNAFGFHAELQKVRLLAEDLCTYNISSFIHLYRTEWATLYTLTTSTNQVNYESERYQKDFATFHSHDSSKRDFHMKTCCRSFRTKLIIFPQRDAASFQEVPN